MSPSGNAFPFLPRKTHQQQQQHQRLSMDPSYKGVPTQTKQKQPCTEQKKKTFCPNECLFLAHKKVFLSWAWEVDSLSILHRFSPIYLQKSISVLPPGLILMHVRMRGPQNSHLFLATSSVFSDVTHQVAFIKVSGSGWKTYQPFWS